MITINCNKRLLAYTFSDSWRRLFYCGLYILYNSRNNWSNQSTSINYYYWERNTIYIL